MTIIGRKDKIDLPEFGLFDIDAKIDTGAYGCALHCHRTEVHVEDGVDTLSFMLLDPDHPEYEHKVFKTTHFSDKVVKSSSGLAEHRYTVYTTIRLFGEDMEVECSLTDRREMKHPILLGRKLLTKKYLVDVSLKNLSFKQKTKAS